MHATFLKNQRAFRALLPRRKVTRANAKNSVMKHLNDLSVCYILGVMELGQLA